MFRKLRLFVGGAGLLLAMSFASMSHASILVPGSTVFPDVFTAPSGAVLLASISAPWVDSGSTMSGTEETAVFLDPTNVLCAGCLDFMYQVSNNPSSTDSIARLTAINFTGFSTDVGFITNGSALPGGLFVTGTATPGLADRNSAGDVVGFTFDYPVVLDEVGPGETSLVLVIETNAKNIAAGHDNLIDGGVTTLSAFEPTAAVPEPASWALMIAGVGAVGLSLRVARRHRGPKVLLAT